MILPVALLIGAACVIVAMGIFVTTPLGSRSMRVATVAWVAAFLFWLTTIILYVTGVTK